jgi:hypothetical protein
MGDELTIYRADFNRPDGSCAATYVQAPTLGEAARYVEGTTDCASVSLLREWHGDTEGEPVALWHRISPNRPGLERPRIEDIALFRCPACFSEELNPEQGESGDRLRCGNCNESLERGEAVVRVDDAEGFAFQLAAAALQSASASQLSELVRLTVLTPSADELPGPFGEDEEDASPLEEIPAWLWPRLKELDALLNGSPRLTLARDWEGFVVGLIDGDERLESLYFNEDGSVARANVNLPPYVGTVAELLAD